MQTIERTYPVKKIITNIDNGSIVFNHPMQRKPDQWDEEQKSLLIHSMLGGYAIPQAYALQMVENDFDIFSVLDGKQRFTTVHSFIKDGFKLSKETPSINLRKRVVEVNETGERQYKTVNEEHEIAGKLFSQIDGELQEKLKDHEFSVVLLVDYTDEEIEDQFYRLNNGTALTKDQKTRVMLGDELAEFIDRQEEKELFTQKSYFNANQRKKGEVQTCILQTLMLIMDYSFKNLNSETLIKFASWFRENHKQSDLDYCVDIFEKLNEALPTTDKPNKLMKKTNIPILAYHIQTVDELGISLEEYGAWIQNFFDTYDKEGEYASYCGQSSTSKAKVMARLEYVERQLKELRGLNEQTDNRVEN